MIADGHPYRTLQAALLQCLDEGSPPSGSGGHVNLSPKGHGDTFTILDGRTVAYLDLTGSGAETVAHLRDNGRITLVFCPSPVRRGSCASMGRDGSSCPATIAARIWRRGFRPAAAPVPLS